MRPSSDHGGESGRLGLVLSRSLSFKDRAAFVAFAKDATIGHWAEVIDTMVKELRREDRDPSDGRNAGDAK